MIFATFSFWLSARGGGRALADCGAPVGRCWCRCISCSSCSSPKPEFTSCDLASFSRGLEYRDDAAGEAVLDVFHPGEAAVEAAKGELLADLVLADGPVGRRIGQQD